MKSKAKPRNTRNVKAVAARAAAPRVGIPAASCVATAQELPPSALPAAFSGKSEADRRFEEWQRKYRDVEVAILEERDRRAESKRRRRGRAFGDLCEMTEGLAVFCRRTGMSLEEAERALHRPRLPHPGLWLAWELGGLAWSALSAIRKEITRRISRADHEAKRPFYYERERRCRQALAEERRKVRMRHTLSPCPTKEAILDAWIHVKDSPEALLRFGSLIEDLECYVDNSLRRDENGEIIGRRPGIKGWLQLEIPALYLKYTTVMAYKAAAKRMRQIIDIRDPLPLSVAMPEPIMENSGEASDGGKIKTAANGGATNVALYGGEMSSQDYGAEEIIGGAGRGAKGRDASVDVAARDGDGDGAGGLRLGEADELDAMRARAVYLEVMGQVGSGRRRQTALFDKLKALTDPEAVEDTNMLQRWRAEYECKITVRTKSSWERRLKWTG